MIEEMRDQFPLCELCQAFQISRSGYYKWLQAAQGERATENEKIVSEIRAIRTDRKLGSYGSPRMVDELKDRGVVCSKNRVARLMRVNKIKARHKRPFRPRTTIGRSSAQASPNILRQTQVTAPEQVLVGDITYVATREGWLYLAVVMDLYTRMIVGWSIGESLETDLVLKALKNSTRVLKNSRTVLFHSDRGCQYSSRRFRAQLASLGVTQSMSARGYCYDNAACESFFSTLKTEGFPFQGVFNSRQEARLEIFDYLETFYNTRRKHSSLANRSPKQFLENHFQTHQPDLN
jgi:putative transposase